MTQRIREKLAPHNVEAEQAVIGAMLIDPDALLKVRSVLEGNDFYVEQNRWVYQAMLHLFENDAGLDMITITDELDRMGMLKEIGGAAYLTNLIGSTPTSLNIKHYAEIVRRHSQLRKLIQAGTRIVQLGYSDDDELSLEERYSKAENVLYESWGEDKGNTATVHVKQAMSELYDEMQYRRENPGMSGIPTGIAELDDVLDGMQRGNLFIVAGRPGMGKSQFALFTAEHAAGKGYKVLIFSQEMSRLQLAQRLTSMRTGINMQRIRKAELLKDNELPVVLAEMEKVSKLPIWISTMPMATPGMMRAEIRRYSAQEGGIDLVIGDHLGLMSIDDGDRGDNETIRLGMISRQSKVIAREENLVFMLLSQLSRAVESRQDRRPVLSDLRGSGRIEENMDDCAFLYRDGRYNPDTEHPKRAEINLAKHRNGPTILVEAEFDATCGQWKSLGLQEKLLLNDF